MNDHADKLACLHHGDQAEAEHQRKIRNGHRDAETRRGLADRRLLEHHGEARLGHDRGKRDHNDLGDDDDYLLDLALELVHNALDGDLRADTQAEPSAPAIAFTTVKKEPTSLPQGQQKEQTEGQEGVLQTTSMVTRSAGKVVSSTVFAKYVKKAPVDKVILVGTGSAEEAAANTLGDTVPSGEKQKWAHDWLLANGYTEADFTAANFIISHESGWSPTATTPSSGAYGLPQALPGSKMASAGADWQTNYQTQFKWFVNYCNGRYGSISGAYAYWQSHKSY